MFYTASCSRSVLMFCLAVVCLTASADIDEELDRAMQMAIAGDYEGAKRIWMPLADEGSPAAQYNMALLYERGIAVEKDLALSASLCLQSATGGNVLAMAHMGTKYLQGMGVDRNVEKALEWFESAAEYEDAGALAALGSFYASPEGGQDFKKAVGYWVRAAQQGQVDSMFNVAIAYDQGIGGVEPDIETALEFYRAAAAGGSLEALANLVSIYSQGDRIERDLKRAYFWCDLSVSAGLEQNREYLKATLSAEDVADVKAEIENWHAIRRSYRDFSAP